jgi:hypothetical protein
VSLDERLTMRNGFLKSYVAYFTAHSAMIMYTLSPDRVSCMQVVSLPTNS